MDKSTTFEASTSPQASLCLIASYLTNGDLCQDVVAAEVAFIVVFHPVCFHEIHVIVSDILRLVTETHQ